MEWDTITIILLWICHMAHWLPVGINEKTDMCSGT